MAILIKGMEMPNYCYECPFHSKIYNGIESQWWCSLLNKIAHDDEGHKTKECPLVEVPEEQPDVPDTNVGDTIRKERLEALPPAQPKQKKGKWNTYYHGVNEDQVFTYSCNQCGYSAPYGLYGGKYSQKEWAYCPNCGADMRGE